MVFMPPASHNGRGLLAMTLSCPSAANVNAERAVGRGRRCELRCTSLKLERGGGVYHRDSLGAMTVVPSIPLSTRMHYASPCPFPLCLP